MEDTKKLFTIKDLIKAGNECERILHRNGMFLFGEAGEIPFLDSYSRSQMTAWLLEFRLSGLMDEISDEFSEQTESILNELADNHMINIVEN